MFGKVRCMRKNAHKAFARKTIIEALSDFMRRYEKRIRILDNQLRSSKRLIEDARIKMEKISLKGE